jgi:hypothetical protein
MNITDLIWPQPPENCVYVEQTFGTCEYISTGYFKAEDVSSDGVGRKFENVQGVTSMFFDADLIGMMDALRAGAGQTLEPKVKDRKAWMYANMSDEQVRKAKDTLLEAVADTLIDVMQGAPHLIVDSGWGWHFHYAVAEDYRMEKDALKRLHIMVVNEVNHLINGTSDLDWPKAFDATNDVGSRICRKVGSWNRKQADRQRGSRCAPD